jgi:ribosomal protein S18 acetylase RimI-like enzyme
MELLLTYSDAEVTALTSLEEIGDLVLVFEAIAAEERWAANNQLRAFVQCAVYFRLTVGGEVAGGPQLVRASTTGRLPNHAVWPELPIAGPEDAHVTMLALKKEFRGRRGLFWLLCGEMYRYCWRERLTRLWLEVTPPTLRAYRRFGWPLEIVGDSRVHWGEECYPCRFDLREAARLLAQRAMRSPTHRQVFEQLFRASH